MIYINGIGMFMVIY